MQLKQSAVLSKSALKSKRKCDIISLFAKLGYLISELSTEAAAATTALLLLH